MSNVFFHYYLSVSTQALTVLLTRNMLHVSSSVCLAVAVIVLAVALAHPNPTDLSGTCSDVAYQHVSKIGVTRLPNYTLPFRNSVTVYHSDVTEKEKLVYASLPPAYTMSNDALRIGNVKGTPRASAWASDNRYIGGLTAAHPRNNRSMCLDVTAQSSIHPVPVYEALKHPSQVSKTSYLDYEYQYIYYAQHGFIHDVGNVVLQQSGLSGESGRVNSGDSVGSYAEQNGCVLQSLSGCDDSVAQVTAKWGTRCLQDLQRLDIHTSDFFELSHRPDIRATLLRKLFVDPYRKSVARRSRDNALSLTGFVNSGAVPKLCLLNMSLLYRDLVPPTGVTITVQGQGQGQGQQIDDNSTANASSPSSTLLLTALSPLVARSHSGGTVSVPTPTLAVLHDAVFVLTSLWDHNYHHFAIDSLVKLIRYLPFLTRYPEIKIHIRRYEQFCKKKKYIRGGIEIRRRFWDLLGLVLRSDVSNGNSSNNNSSSSNSNDNLSGHRNVDDSHGNSSATTVTSSSTLRRPLSDTEISGRIISGPIIAKHVYVPKSTECNWAISSAHNVRLLANYLLWSSYIFHRNATAVTTVSSISTLRSSLSLLRTGMDQGPGYTPTTTRYTREDSDVRFIQGLLDRIHGRVGREEVGARTERMGMSGLDAPSNAQKQKREQRVDDIWGWYDDQGRGENVMTTLPDFFSHRLHAKKHDLATVSQSGHQTSATTRQSQSLGQLYLPDGVRVLLQLRDCTTDSKTCKHDWREWDKSEWPAVIAALNQRIYAPRSNDAAELDNSQSPVTVIPLTSSNSTLMNCLTCQIHDYYSTSQILIGIHGAGLTNMMFMPPGSIVFEIVGKFDGRMLPLCGYHGSLASVFGIHHYLYYYDWKADTAAMPNITDIADKLVEFYTAVMSAQKSYAQTLKQHTVNSRKDRDKRKLVEPIVMSNID